MSFPYPITDYLSELEKKKEAIPYEYSETRQIVNLLIVTATIGLNLWILSRILRQAIQHK